MKDRLIKLHRGAFLHLLDTEKPFTHANYADYLLANGVIVPPCKVGDTVYGIYTHYRNGKQSVFEYDVEELIYCSNRGVRPWIITCFGGTRFDNCDFGKTVFFTREEAEKALAERSKNEI